MIRAFQHSSAPPATMTRALQDAQETQMLAQLKLDLIRMALDKYSQQLPSDSPKRSALVVWLSDMLARTRIQMDAPPSPTVSDSGSARSTGSGRVQATTAPVSIATRRLQQSLAVTGRLEVR
jgi:hypothetical protein